MKDTSKILRHGVYALLNGNISYESADVPVYDEKKPDNIPGKLFILLGTQQESPEDTHDTFITRSSIDIEVVEKTGSGVSKDAIDDVANEVLEILFPTPMSDQVITHSDYYIMDLRREQSITRVLETSSTESIIRKIITISSRILEK